MKLTVSEPLPLPAEEVFHLLRDDMPRLVPFLHDIARIEVTDRVDDGDTVRLRLIRPCWRSEVAGRFSVREVTPTAGAITAIVSPG